MDNENLLDIIIRRAKSADRDRILQIQIDAIQTLLAQDYLPEQIEALLEGKRERYQNSISPTFNESVFVAENEGEVLGFASLGFFRIDALFVDPRYARQKIGTQLLTALENEARSRFWKVLSITSSLTAQPFYLDRGYRLIDNSSIFVVNKRVRVPCLEMEKWLLPSQEWEEWIWNGVSGMERTTRGLFMDVLERMSF